MVRRIIPDSDFESDDDIPPYIAPITEDKPSSNTASSSRIETSPPPQSKRRVVRHKDVHPEPDGTDTYDSDIYTEESSMGSFIVYTDDENDEQVVDDDSTTDDENHNSNSVTYSSSDVHSHSAAVFGSDDLLSEALLVYNPQKSPRKQTSIMDKQAIPTSSTCFRYPLPSLKESSSKFWDEQDHYNWIDGNTPVEVSCKSPPKASSPSTPTRLNAAKKAFIQAREQLALDLVREIDEKVMGGELSASTETTGGVKLEWSTRLRTAAGRAHWTRVKSRTLGDQTKDQHNLKIELSTKIVTSEEKLRDTLAHELCHCALWVIDKDPKSHHGKQFKQWGTRITKEFPDILVTTKHTYEIDYKYTYTCTNSLCGLDFGRQKKLALNRHVCGACKSSLAQTKPSPSTSGKENKANPFGLFVKDHFAKTKSENPGAAHKDIMVILSKLYREQKTGGVEVSQVGSQTILIEDTGDDVVEMATSFGILDLE